MATPPSLDALILKGTHNSYDPVHRIPPWDQVNDYGVWVVELDYMIPAELLRQAHDRDLPTPVWDTEPPAVVIGHDGPGMASDGGAAVFGGPHVLLRDYLTALAATEAFRFRPLLVYLDRKDFFVPGPLPLNQPPSLNLIPLHDPTFHDHPQRLTPIIEGILKDVFSQGIFSVRPRSRRGVSIPRCGSWPGRSSPSRTRLNLPGISCSTSIPQLKRASLACQSAARAQAATSPTSSPVAPRMLPLRCTGWTTSPTTSLLPTPYRPIHW